MRAAPDIGINYRAHRAGWKPYPGVGSGRCPGAVAPWRGRRPMEGASDAAARRIAQR
jgi:hypothetical protein